MQDMKNIEFTAEQDSWLLRIETKRAAIRREAENMAFGCYIRTGRVPRKLREIMQATKSLESLLKYNPNWDQQPRIPAGQPGAGQWEEGGGTGGGDDQPSDEPGLEPVYPVETLALGLVGISARGAMAAARIAMGLARSIGSAYRINKAAKAIEDYLGGRPDKTIRNPAGDLVMMRDGKKIRFDINNFSPHDEPHFHIERQSANGKWKPAGSQHVYSFRKE